MHDAFMDRLFEPAISHIYLTAHYELRVGWTLRVSHTHSGEEHPTCPSDDYEPLTAGELIQVADASLTDLLGWPS